MLSLYVISSFTNHTYGKLEGRLSCASLFSLSVDSFMWSVDSFVWWSVDSFVWSKTLFSTLNLARARCCAVAVLLRCCCYAAADGVVCCCCCFVVDGQRPLDFLSSTSSSTASIRWT